MAMKSTDTPDTVILVNAGGVLTAPSFAGMGWLRPDVNNSGTPFGVWSGTGAAQRAWRIRMTDSPVRIRGIVSFDGSASNTASAPTALTLNVWAHVGMDFDGSTIRVFLNGVLDFSLSASGTIFASSHRLGIGGYDEDGTSETASEQDGDIEDVRYYNRILTAEEWATIHGTRGLDGIVNGLVTRWPINEEPDGNTIVTPKDVGPAQLSVSLITNTPSYIEGELRQRKAA